MCMTEWALGLIGADPTQPSGELFRAFLAVARKAFERAGLEVTHIALGGGASGDGKYHAVNGSRAQKIMNSGFCGALSLSVISAPPKSNNPAYEYLALLTLSWNPKYERLLCAVFKEDLAPFGGVVFMAILSDLVTLGAWSLGYSFQANEAGRAETHVLGGDSGDLDDAESKALWRWYSADVDDRRTRFRDVYPVLIFKSSLLSTRVGEGSLSDFIANARVGICSRVGEFLVWQVPADQILATRHALSRAGLLIAPIQ